MAPARQSRRGGGRAASRLSRFHLERFANERLQIATVDRRTGQRRITAIRDTAAEKDFYTAINTEGEKESKTEHLLTGRRGLAAGEHRVQDVPDRAGDVALDVLCLFLAFQKVRGKLTS
jgi:hypothetical protein